MRKFYITNKAWQNIDSEVSNLIGTQAEQESSAWDNIFSEKCDSVIGVFLSKYFENNTMGVAQKLIRFSGLDFTLHSKSSHSPVVIQMATEELKNRNLLVSGNILDYLPSSYSQLLTPRRPHAV